VECAKGDPGDPGTPATSVTHSWNGTVLTVTSASGTSSADLKGAKGDPGYPGTSVKHSWNGTELIVTSASGTSSANLKGAKGDPGDPGTPGTSVEHSWNGTELTLKSASGTTKTDLKGENGVTPIIEIHDDDEIAVSYDGGHSWTILGRLPKGADGKDGAGVSSILKTSTNGLVDIYTIELTNGQKSYLTVTNGQDGITAKHIVEQHPTNGIFLIEVGKRYKIAKTVKNATQWGFTTRVTFSIDDTPYMQDVVLPDCSKYDDYLTFRLLDVILDNPTTNGVCNAIIVMDLNGELQEYKTEIGSNNQNASCEIEYAYIQGASACYLINEEASIDFEDLDESVQVKIKPEFVQSVEELEALPEEERSKVYVLLDETSPYNGYIFAWMKIVTEGKPLFKNLMDDPDAYIKPGQRYSQSGGGFTTSNAENDCAIVIPIPETAGAFTIRVKEATIASSKYHTSAYFGTNNQTFSGKNDTANFAYSDDGKGTVTFTQKVYNGGYKYFVVHVANNVDEANLIVTLNEEITDEKTESEVVYKWANTGLAFIHTDYEPRIIEAETKLDEHEERLDDLERNPRGGLSLEHNSCSIFRKVVCCGDSFTAGYIGTNNDNIIQTNWDYAWPSFMARLTGNEYVNCGHSGKDVLTWQTSAKGLPRAQAAGKAQAYLIGLGLNDATLVTLGTAADIGTDAQTYYGGLSKIIRELNAISPTAKIFVQTIPSDYVVYMNYSQAMRDVVNAYKDTYPVHLLDLYEYKSMYKTAKVTGDAIMGHHTAIGYQQFAENLRYVWSDYINKHISEFQDVYLIPIDETPADLV
jgi:lysophospholipase L1-like esterase